MANLKILERRAAVLAAALAVTVGSFAVVAQVKTDVPDPSRAPSPQPSSASRFTARRSKATWKATPSIATRIVFLPPSYARERTRRYPVVYALHGYSIGAEQWSQEIHVPQTIEGAFAKGAQEMIVVLPDSKTVHNGSMYSSSVTTGDFEQFIARDVVAYIDAHYRTIPSRSEPRTGRPFDGRLRREPHRHEARRRVRQPVHHEPVLPVARAAARARRNRRTTRRRRWRRSRRRPIPRSCRSACARSWRRAAAWSPNPKNPPLYLDLPIEDGEAQPDVLAKWAANAPLAFVDQYIGNLKQYRAIAIDVGDQDGLRVDAGKLHDMLDQLRHRQHLRDLSGHAHERRRGPVPELRDAVLQPDAVVRAGEAMTRLRSARAAATAARLAPALALDGQPGMHDPSTVIEADGKFYVYATGNGLPAFASDDGWTWRRAGSVMQAVPGGKPGPT